MSPTDQERSKTLPSSSVRGNDAPFGGMETIVSALVSLDSPGCPRPGDGVFTDSLGVNWLVCQVNGRFVRRRL